MVKKFKNNSAITLISLVITIVVLIILASVGIYLSLGNNGIFTRAKEAKERTNKQTATEIINLKITTAQMNKYAEEQRMPTLKELSLVFGNDNEIEYVTEQSKKRASTEYNVQSENPSSIFIKLNEYPYEFEINGQLQLASIDGIKLANGQTNTSNTNFETKVLTYGDLFKETSSYINALQELTIVKSNYLIQFSLYTSPSFTIPNASWTTIGVLKDEYCPKIDVNMIGTTGNVSHPILYFISSNGTIKVYQNCGAPNQCMANCIYILK